MVKKLHPVSAHFLNLSQTSHLACLQLIIQPWLFFLLFSSPSHPLRFPLQLPLLFSLSPVACLPATTPPVHQHRGQEEGIYSDTWIVIPTEHSVCQCTAGSSLQHAHTHRFQSSAHSIRMARKLDWHLNNRINGAYGLSVNTVTM